MGLFSRFVAKIKGESTASALDWDELSSDLLAADLGPTLTEKVILEAKKIKGDDAEGAVEQCDGRERKEQRAEDAQEPVLPLEGFVERHQAADRQQQAENKGAERGEGTGS
mgnify:CR=1 FL=1